MSDKKLLLRNTLLKNLHSIRLDMSRFAIDRNLEGKYWNSFFATNLATLAHQLKQVEDAR